MLAPHPDDEVLGCGGTIARRVAEGWRVDVVVARLTSGDASPAEVAELRADLVRAGEVLGVTRTTVLIEGGEGDLDHLPRRELVARIDTLFEEEGYAEVLFPYASHHQDHRAVHEAVFSALRPRPALNGLRRVGLYEYPWVGWDPAPPPGGRWYVDISEHLETKIAALEAYRDLRDRDGHPISIAGVRALAAQRGVECGVRHAELFRVLRCQE